MSATAGELSALVDYSVDKWRMDRLPLGLWAIVGGLAICLNADGRAFSDATLAVTYLGLLALAFGGWALTNSIERSGYPFYVVLPVVLIVVFVVVVLISLFGTLGRHRAPGRLWWSQLVDPPFSVFGWMALYLGVGWCAFVVASHYFPRQPIVRLSPAGISFHRSWLPDLLIPWQQIKSVGPLVRTDPQGPTTTYPLTAAIAVEHAFYQQHIAPKRGLLSPPGSERMFEPNGALMQMVLTSPELLVTPKDFLGPIEARWRVFKDLAPAALPGSAGTPMVFGRWSFDGSWWQTTMLAAPLLGAVAVLMHASGLWPH